MSEIQAEIDALASQATRLSGKVDFWNDWVVWSLIAAAVVAGLVVLTTRMVIVRGKQLSTVQDELVKAKDRQLALGLRDRDIKIAEANRAAEQARLDLARYRAPRLLNAEQQKRLGARLTAANLHKNQDIWVTAAPLTVETGTLANQILSAVRHAVPRASSFSGGENIQPMTQAAAVSDVMVFSTRDARSVKVAEVLERGLMAEGISAGTSNSLLGCENIETDPDNPRCFHVLVVIGPKR